MSNICYVIVRREVTTTPIDIGFNYEETLKDKDPVLVCRSFDAAVKAKGKMIKETYHKEYAKKGPRTDVFLAGDGSVEIHTEDGTDVSCLCETITTIDFMIKEVPMNM